MKAKHIYNFTRGGDPYRKLGVGKYENPPGIVEMDELADKVFFHWDVYFDDERAGIEQTTEDDRQVIRLNTYKLNGMQDREEFMTGLDNIRRDSEIYTEINDNYDYEEDDDLSPLEVIYQITIYPKWKE